MSGQASAAQAPPPYQQAQFGGQYQHQQQQQQQQQFAAVRSGPPPPPHYFEVTAQHHHHHQQQHHVQQFAAPQPQYQHPHQQQYVPDHTYGRGGYPVLPTPQSHVSNHMMPVAPQTAVPAYATVSKFTPPPPPNIAWANEISHPESETHHTKVGDLLFSQARRWVQKLDVWLVAHPRDRPSAPCPTPEHYTTVEAWLAKLGAWYEANFDSCKIAGARNAAGLSGVAGGRGSAPPVGGKAATRNRGGGAARHSRGGDEEAVVPMKASDHDGTTTPAM